MKKYLWNRYGLRLQYIKSQSGNAWNWLFLPGGPGLGSESLNQLTVNLNLPGNLWHIDLPGDGSNTTANNTESFKTWPLALEEVCDAFDNIILVGHSTGGMYALSLPSLEKKLSGLILIASAPNASWQDKLAKKIHSSPIDELKYLNKIYKTTPSNKILKELTIATAPYLFTKEGLDKGKILLQNLSYNNETCSWSEIHFDSTYKAKWIPQSLPTLIIAGSKDYITPITLFKNHHNFKRNNILIKEISNAGHFPWIENLEEVATAFKEFIPR